METAFGILHKLRAGMVRPAQDRFGGMPGEHVEIDETCLGSIGRTRGDRSSGVHHKVLVAAVPVEVRHRNIFGNRAGQAKGRHAMPGFSGSP